MIQTEQHLLRTDTTALAVVGVQKVYGGETALGGVDLALRPGEIHGLLGANGAGKSTLVRIICGAERADAGSVTMFGQTLPPGSPQAAKSLGLAYIHQDRALAPDLSVADNVALSTGYTTRWGLVDTKAARARAAEALQRVGLDVDPDTVVEGLTIAAQTLVAIARALAESATVLLLDEPTANLGARDSARLYKRLRMLAEDGTAVLLITHALDEALAVCDQVTVLRNGLVVADAPSSELTTEVLARHIVGSAHALDKHRSVARFDRTASTSSPRAPRLTIRDLEVEEVGPLSLSVEPGEIVGVTGLADSGHLLVGEAVFGVQPVTSGTLELDGTVYRPSTVSAARARGLGFVPPDRVRDGLAVDLSARENLFLDGVLPSARQRRIDESRSAAAILRTAGVKPADPDAPLSTLSGGNMQKVLVAKWLQPEPRLLILSEPTVGVDVGARDDIYTRVREACSTGMSVLLTSSDFDEVTALCDRALVLRYGRPVGWLAGAEISVNALAGLAGAVTTSKERDSR